MLLPKRRRTPKVYSPAERSAIVGEIQRRQRAESRSIEVLARQLGISDKTYYNWIRAGVRAEAELPAAIALPVAAESCTDVAKMRSGRRYTASERETLLAEITRRREAGEPLGKILQAIGPGRTAYVRWREDARPAPEFRAVALVEASPNTSVALVPAEPPAPTLALPVPVPSSALTLVAPGGYRIEGLAVESAAALLRALS